MHWFTFLVHTCLLFAILLPQIYTRKYDIEAEAMRLYGENLQSVMHRFRRSPEYLKILQDKHEEVRRQREQVLTFSLLYIAKRLDKRIADFCGYNPQMETSPIPVARYYKPYNARRDGVEGEEVNKTRPEDKLKKINLFGTPIEILDSYDLFRSSLTIKERNKLRDIAFEATGQVIHMTIRGMGPVEYHSTRQPFGNQEVSTERDHRHMISSTKGHYEVMGESTTHRPSSAEHSPMDDTLRSLKTKLTDFA